MDADGLETVYRFTAGEWFAYILNVLFVVWFGVFFPVSVIVSKQYSLLLFPWPLILLIVVYCFDRGVNVPYVVFLEPGTGNLIFKSFFFTRTVPPASFTQIRITPYLRLGRAPRGAVLKYAGGRIAIIPYCAGFDDLMAHIEAGNPSFRYVSTWIP